MKKGDEENPEIKKGADAILGQITFKYEANAFRMKLASVDKCL